MAKKTNDGYDWIELAASAGRLIGLSPVRTRWRLRAWQDRMRGKGRVIGQKAQAITRENKICPNCGAINGVNDKTCVNCNTKLRSRFVELIDRSLRHFSLGASPETALAVCFIITFALISINGPASNWFNAGVHDLLFLGGNDVEYSLFGQWWRLGTSVFLHAGIIHLAFNTYALVYIMPFVRDIYGNNKAIFVFVVTGLGASLGSAAWQLFRHDPAVSIGASGAISGLIGLMLVWGHRDGTSLGKNIRNSMARWVLYTFVFGFMIGADNAAHAAGWVLGGALALTLPTSFAPRHGQAWKTLGTISWIIIAGLVAFIVYRGLFLPFPVPINPAAP